MRQPPPNNIPPKVFLYLRLEELVEAKRLFDKRLISEEAFREQRIKYLKTIFHYKADIQSPLAELYWEAYRKMYQK